MYNMLLDICVKLVFLFYAKQCDMLYRLKKILKCKTQYYHTKTLKTTSSFLLTVNALKYNVNFGLIDALNYVY